MSTTLIEQVAAAHTRAAHRTQDGPTGADERWTIVMERTYDHPREEVWDCWTEPNRLARWLGRVDRRPAVGESVRMVMAPEVQHDVELLDCAEPESLTVRWGGFGEGESRVRVTFSDVDGGTRVRLEHSGLPAGSAWSYGAGWGEVMHLAALAAADPAYDVAQSDGLERAGLEDGLQHYWDDLVPTGRAG